MGSLAQSGEAPARPEHISLGLGRVRLELFRLDAGAQIAGQSCPPGAYIATGPGGLCVIPERTVDVLLAIAKGRL